MVMMMVVVMTKMIMKIMRIWLDIWQRGVSHLEDLASLADKFLSIRLIISLDTDRYIHSFKRGSLDNQYIHYEDNEYPMIRHHQQTNSFQ